MVFDGFSDSKYSFALEGVMQIWASYFDYVLYRLFSQFAEPLFERLSEHPFNPVLKIVLHDVRKEVAKLPSALSHSLSRKIGIVNPLCQRRQITAHAQRFKACNYIHISKLVAAHINFSNYSNPRLVRLTVQLNGPKLVGNRAHKLDASRQIPALLNSPHPVLDRLLIELLSVTGIHGQRPDPQN